MGGRRSCALLLLGLGGCVTTTTDEPPMAAPLLEQTTLVIPAGQESGPRGDGPIDQYYSSIFLQMQEALTERDLPRLTRLVVGHDRKKAPPWVVERMDRFFTALLGLEFEAHASRSSQLEVKDGIGPMGAPVQYSFRLDTPSNREIVLVDDRVEGLSFLATLLVVDHDVYGGRTTHRSSRILRLKKPETRHAPRTNEASFGTSFDANHAVVRELHATVELLPGTVQVDGRDAPIQRLELVRSDGVMYPAGVEAIRDKPLVTLRNAISLGDRAHYPHQYLAARFMPSSSTDEALGLLIERVRLGNAGQARVAMACLAVITGEDLPVGDRETWLAWWQRR